MNKAEFIATLKYSFDQPFHGNRCPLTVGLHADIYSGAEPASNATPLEMREAVKEFLDYVMRESDVRVVSARELLEWLREPKPLAE